MINSFKLPVLEVVFNSYQVLFENQKTYLELIWTPFLAYCLVDVLDPDMKQIRFEHINSTVFWVLASVSTIIGAIAIVPAITAWHRLIILGEENANSRIRYSFRQQEWEYLWRATILVMVVLALYGIALGISMYAVEKMPLLNSVFGYGVVLSLSMSLLFLPFAGYMLLLPATAIGAPMSLAYMRILSRGNLWRIWAIYLIAFAPEIFLNIALYAIQLVTGPIDVGKYFDVFVFARTVSFFVFFMISVGAISIAFKMLVENFPQIEDIADA